MLLTPAQIKSDSFKSRRNVFLFLFLPGADESHVYVSACFRRALTALLDSCAEIKSAPLVA